MYDIKYPLTWITELNARQLIRTIYYKSLPLADAVYIATGPVLEVQRQAETAAGI